MADYVSAMMFELDDTASDITNPFVSDISEEENRHFFEQLKYDPPPVYQVSIKPHQTTTYQTTAPPPPPPPPQPKSRHPRCLQGIGPISNMLGLSRHKNGRIASRRLQAQKRMRRQNQASTGQQLGKPASSVPSVPRKRTTTEGKKLRTGPSSRLPTSIASKA